MGDDLTEQRAVTVRAPLVVVACGALESPALLRRSGIGGPAVGDYLRLHPAAGVFRQYATDQPAYLGAPPAGLGHQFAGGRDGYGFLIGGAPYSPRVPGAALPRSSAGQHKG